MQIKKCLYTNTSLKPLFAACLKTEPPSILADKSPREDDSSKEVLGGSAIGFEGKHVVPREPDQFVEHLELRIPCRCCRARNWNRT